MASQLRLESFEDFGVEQLGPTEDFNKGYAEGLAAGEAAAKADAAVLSETLVQTIADLNFTYAEARGLLLQGLVPLFDVISEKILPHCVKTGFSNQLAVMLTEAARDALDQPITLCVHPDQQDAVKEGVQKCPIEVAVKADTSLTLHAARIQQGARETMLDADRLLNEITGILAAIEYATERKHTHG